MKHLPSRRGIAPCNNARPGEAFAGPRLIDQAQIGAGEVPIVGRIPDLIGQDKLHLAMTISTKGKLVALQDQHAMRLAVLAMEYLVHAGQRGRLTGMKHVL